MVRIPSKEFEVAGHLEKQKTDPQTREIYPAAPIRPYPSPSSAASTQRTTENVRFCLADQQRDTFAS